MDSKKQKPVIGWIVTANPFEGERYYLRILLNHIRGHLSFDHIKTVDGIIAPTFREAATLHGLLNLDIFVSKQGGLARLLCLSRLIVYDEAPMSRKESIETFDKMLRDINDPELPFGGKIVVFGRDFRQVLPVVRKDTRQEKINASLAASYLWPMMKKITLSENMRARLDLDFSEYLLQVGNGTSPITIEENIKVPSEMLIPYTNDLESLEDLIDAVFGDMNIYSDNLLQMSNRAILTSRNVYVDQINAILIERFPSEIIRYYTFDETIDSSEQSIMEDFLNTLTPNGLPPHELLLKKNCPIMLFRNIDPSKGLCNGTRLICRNFNRNVIDAKIAIGHYSGKRVFIPRILFLPNADENNGFSFNRTQLPIRLSFAMTINKLQGQILDFVGIYLSQPVFCHGQLYVALSRAKSSSSIKVLIRPISNDQSEESHTKNIVYGDLLKMAHST
ncbi:ATP-dependent DNA helicase PIF1-like [Carya illinoinensis]|uniref:ATP-dependent DNA helicase PIF1-like n=1 Tax=Carya illinoinensis TaxID=32201 RepID=UPI001C71B285|nr:ATP-dependent DNA helicase PIF1-like [Carya illinoinensis]